MKAQRRRQLPWIFGIFIIIVVVVSNLIAESNANPATIEEFSPGYFKNGEIILTHEIPLHSEHIYACGKLVANRPALMQIYFFDATENVVADAHDPLVINPGQFCAEIFPLSGETFAVGKYHVRAIYAHEIIGETMLSITN